MDTAKQASRVTLRTVAEFVGLTPGTVSAVLNNSRAAERIPHNTRERVIAAARQLNYQPNPLARALRTGRGMTSDALAGESMVARGALVILKTDQFERALSAIQQAGLRVPDDVSVFDFQNSATEWEPSTFASASKYPTLGVAGAS